jgi:hypothetical protein
MIKRVDDVESQDLCVQCDLRTTKKQRAQVVTRKKKIERALKVLDVGLENGVNMDKFKAGMAEVTKHRPEIKLLWDEENDRYRAEPNGKERDEMSSLGIIALSLLADYAGQFATKFGMDNAKFLINEVGAACQSAEKIYFAIQVFLEIGNNIKGDHAEDILRGFKDIFEEEGVDLAFEYIEGVEEMFEDIYESRETGKPHKLPPDLPIYEKKAPEGTQKLLAERSEMLVGILAQQTENMMGCKYNQHHHFDSPFKICFHMMECGLPCSMEGEKLKLTSNTGRLWLSGCKLARHLTPIFWFGESLMEALDHTEMMKDLRFSELNWPHNAMLFQIPIGFLKDPYGRDMTSLSICHIHEGERIRFPEKMIPTGNPLTYRDMKMTKPAKPSMNVPVPKLPTSTTRPTRKSTLKDYG